MSKTPTPLLFSDTFPLLLTSVLLALVPLHRRLTIFLNASGRELWNFSEVLLLLVLIIFYGFHVFFPRKTIGKKSVQLSVWLSCAVLVISVVPHPSAIVWGEVARILLLIWSIPLFTTSWRIMTFSRSALLLVALVVIHSIWGIGQFIVQSDLGLVAIGESRLSPELTGVAKFALTDTYKVLRAYGPYAHANVLGGIIVLGLSLATLLPDTYPRLHKIGYMFPLLLALLLTFSRSAWLGAFSLVAIWFVRGKKTDSTPKFHLDKLLIFLLTVLLFMPFFIGRFADDADQAVPERVAGMQQAIDIWMTQPWVGVGLGNYTHALQAWLTPQQLPYEPWHIAPVHSVPLLLLSETGVLGVAMVLIIFIAMYRRRREQISRELLVGLLPLVPLMLFDHYMLTQTAPMVWAFAYLTLLAQVPPLGLLQKQV